MFVQATDDGFGMLDNTEMPKVMGDEGSSTKVLRLTDLPGQTKRPEARSILSASCQYMAATFLRCSILGSTIRLPRFGGVETQSVVPRKMAGRG